MLKIKNIQQAHSMNQITSGSIQTDYRYLNIELALKPAKNATTTNPFKIISVQSTRRENSWETEQMLARAA
jgi:hypothetical protein